MEKLSTFGPIFYISSRLFQRKQAREQKPLDIYQGAFVIGADPRCHGDKFFGLHFI
jgi:hypothetical protein